MRKLVLLLVVASTTSLAVACTDEPVAPVSGTGCYLDSRDVLAAQSVPSAAYVPCVAAVEEFALTSSTYDSDGTHLRYETARLDGSWTVRFSASCEVGNAERKEVDTDADAELFVATDDGGRFRQTNYLTFEGGCVTSTVDLPESPTQEVVAGEAGHSLHLIPRSAVNAHVEDETDGKLSLDPE